MSTVTLRPRSVPTGSIRRLSVAGLQVRLLVLERRADILADVLPRWHPRGSNARQNLRELRSERSAIRKELRIVRRAIAAVLGGPEAS
jgi:hypothetical protein